MDIKEFVMSIPEFQEVYEFLDIDTKILETLKQIPKTYSMKVFASKTCQYCKIYIPNLLRLYEELLFDLDFVVWEDYTDEETFDLMDSFKLTGLPTIIIYSITNRKEIGRFVKEPKISLEKDLLDILESIG